MPVGFHKNTEYEEIFVPDVKMTSVRTLVVVASARKMTPISDGCKECLYSCDLSEVVYMQPLSGVSAH